MGSILKEAKIGRKHSETQRNTTKMQKDARNTDTQLFDSEN